MGSTLSETQFNTIIMSSLPESYQPTLQTITAAKQANRLSGGQSSSMKHNDLIAFITEEAQHQVINDKRGKNAEVALAAHVKRNKAGKKKKSKEKSEEECENCQKPGHGKDNCYAKGCGKEGQAPWQNKGKKANKTETITVAADEGEDEMFAFACSSDYVALAESLQLPKSKLETCIDSGTSQVYSLNC